MRKRWWMVLLGLTLAIQFVPYGRGGTNPPVAEEPEWSDARTRELFFQACRDCHSNETRWPWYAEIAPASWLVRWDVEEGRSHFNVSEWGRESNHGDEAAELVRSAEMPLPQYLLLHPEARLAEAERETLAAGLAKTFGEADAAHETSREHGEGSQ